MHRTVCTQVYHTNHVILYIPFNPVLFEALPCNESNFVALTCRLELEDAIMFFIDIDAELCTLVKHTLHSSGRGQGLQVGVDCNDGSWW